MTSIHAQVKIGDNPGTINSNSLLELESIDKGFLPPRMALNNLNLAAPLTGGVTAGMLIYSSGGTVADGYYYWDGIKWLPLGPSITRDNYVLVKSAADFPAPVAGVITLGTGILYEINGTITLANKIDLNSCTLFGQDADEDKLIYTGTSELFTGANGGTLKSVTLIAPTGNIFNINAGGAVLVSLIVTNCYLLSSNNVGTVQGIGGYVYFGNNGFYANTNGITFQNCSYVYLNNSVWDISNTNTFERFIGTFSAVQILGGSRNVSSGNTAVNITGITSITNGSIKVALFLGAGTYIAGTFSNAWEVESDGLVTEKDDVSSGNIYITTPTVTTFTAVATPTKVLGTTASVNLFRVTAPINNRLTYTGAKTKKFLVVCSISITSLGNNKNYSFYIAKNGIPLTESEISRFVSTGGDQGALQISCTVSLATNDYISVWVKNNTDATGMTVQSMNLSIR